MNTWRRLLRSTRASVCHGREMLQGPRGTILHESPAVHGRSQSYA